MMDETQEQEINIRIDVVNELINTLMNKAKELNVTYIELFQMLTVTTGVIEAAMVLELENADVILARMNKAIKEREEQIIKDLKDVLKDDKIERDLQILELPKPKKKKSSRQNLRQAK